MGTKEGLLRLSIAYDLEEWFEAVKGQGQIADEEVFSDIILWHVLYEISEKYHTKKNLKK